MRYREYQVAELFRLLGKHLIPLPSPLRLLRKLIFLPSHILFFLVFLAQPIMIQSVNWFFYSHIYSTFFIELFTLQPPLSEDFYWTLDDAAVQVVGNYCIWYTLFSPLLLIPSSEPCSGSPLLYMRARPDIHCQRWVVDGEGKETSHAGLSWGWLRQVSPKKRTMIG